MTTVNMAVANNLGLFILRLFVGGLLLFHGIAKMQHGVGMLEGMLAQQGIPSFLAYGVYVGEVIAPLMVILGIFTRIGGLLVVVNMLFAILLAHTKDFFLLSEHGGMMVELPLLYLGGGLALALLGGGQWGVMMGRGKWN